MTIPLEVKIGAITYQVFILDDWMGRDGDDGECTYDKKRGHCIFIGADLSQPAQEITFIHESLHAMNSTINHEFLDSLSEQLYAFLKENDLLK
jgi:Zn-dependent peptidase ImmA (M78 family)